MEALGLQQHVSFQIHHAVNILHLIFTEANSQFGIKTFKGRYVSNHRVMVSELSIGIQHTTDKTVTFRNLKQINVEEFGSTLDLGSIEDTRDLELVNRIYEEELSRVLNHLAPEKTKFITKKEKRPWFDEDMAILRRILRRSEKIWMRIRSAGRLTKKLEISLKIS